MDQSKIGAFISALRTEQGMTQAQFGERIGVSQRTVSRWETGRNMPDYSLLFPICEALGVNVAELLNGERMESPQVEKAAVTSTVEAVIRIADAKRIFQYVVGAILSLLVTLLVMFCLYQSEFSVALGSTVDLENVINEFYFLGGMQSDVVESQSVGSRLFVLYRQAQSKGGSGLAVLEKGIFGTYRILSTSNSNSLLISCREKKVGGKTYAVISCVNDLPEVEAFGICGFYPDKSYDFRYDNPGDLLFQEAYPGSPFLLIQELPKGFQLSDLAVEYCMKDGRRLHQMDLQESPGDTVAPGAFSSTTDMAEAGVIYEMVGVIFLVGMVFVLSFLRNLKK